MPASHGYGVEPVALRLLSPCCPAKPHACLQGCMQELTIQLPSGSPPGLAWLEVQRGALLSPAQPVLLVPDAGLAAEAQSLLAPQCSTTAHSPAQALLVDLGLALRAHYTGLHACPLEPGPLALSASRCVPCSGCGHEALHCLVAHADELRFAHCEP